MSKILWLIAFQIHAAPIEPDSSLLVLRPGEMRTVKVAPGAAIRVSSSQVVRVLDQGPKLALFGRKIGRAVISHGRGAWRIEVASPEVQATYLAFEGKLKTMKGLTLDLKDNMVFVNGTLLRWRDWAELADAQAATGGRWQMRATLDSFLQSKITPLIQENILGGQNHGYVLGLSPYPRLTASANWLEAPAEAPRLEQFGLVTATDKSQITLSPTIRLRLTFAEVQTNSADSLGLEFQDGQQVQVLPKFRAPTELSATLHVLAAKGQARILANPMLTCRSGMEAEFLAGGEFAVRISNRKIHEVQWKRHGLWLKFKPQYENSGLVRLDVQTEFSMPDFSQALDGIPGLRTNKANSSVDMPLGKTLLLTGLIRTWQGESWSGVKGLSEIPILGRLFRSDNFSKNRSELLVFVSPELLDSDPWK